MERLARLEVKVDHLETQVSSARSAIDGLDARVRAVEIGVATLIERVAHLPSKGFIVWSLLAILGVVGALIAFQDQVQTILHTKP